MKAPAFQLYVSDFMGDALVDVMEPEELGGYFRLLLVAWQQEDRGYLPNDAQLLAKWSRLRRRWSTCAPAILACFKTAPDGRLYQKRMVQVAEEQSDYRLRQSEAGKRGNAKRWASQPDRNSIATRSHGDALAIAGASPEHRSPSPPPSPSEILKTIAPPAESPPSFDLESIYNRYPRKKDMAKGKAKLRAIIKTQADFDAVSRGLDRFLAEERRKGTAPEYYPYFATWVNRRRWEDEDDKPTESLSSQREYEDLEDIIRRTAPVIP